MQLLRRLAPLALLALLLAGFATPAQAKLKATSSLVTTAGKTRLTVTLTSTKALGARSRPRKVSAKAGKTKVKLKRVKGSSAAVSAGTWRSSALSSKKLAKFTAKVGKRLKVIVVTRSGRVTLKPKLTVPGAGGGGGGGGGSLFAPPGKELTGQAAISHLTRYFVNSRFTDCVARWPNCPVEMRYSHCDAQGSWEYHRYTSVSGADINSVGSYGINPAGTKVHADGSWTVEYAVEAYSQISFYHWDVSTNGSVTGAYWSPGTNPQGPPSEQLGPLVWAQPAICGQT